MSDSDSLNLGKQLGALSAGLAAGEVQRVEMAADIKEIRKEMSLMRADFAAHLKDDAKVADDIRRMQETLDKLAPQIQSAFVERRQASWFVSGMKYAVVGLTAVVVTAFMKFEAIVAWIKAH